MVQQTQTWCNVCGNGDYSTNTCATNLESVNFLWVMLNIEVIKFLGKYRMQVGKIIPTSQGVEIKGKMLTSIVTE